MDICCTLVLVCRQEGCPQDRSVPGTQVRFIEVVSSRTRRYDQECYQGSDTDAFERVPYRELRSRAWTGEIGPLFDYRLGTPFGRGGSERSLAGLRAGFATGSSSPRSLRASPPGRVQIHIT
jgi:hypothetical protein